jgi:hypothetical protein
MSRLAKDPEAYLKLRNVDMFYWIVENLEFKQVIWEFGNGNNPGWIHMSHQEGNNKGKITLAWKDKGKATYTHFYNIEDFNAYKDGVYDEEEE